MTQPIRVAISNDPLTNFKRSLTFDVYLLQSLRQIIVRCIIDSFDEDDNLINNSRVSSYMRELVASDSIVDPNTGQFSDQGIQEYDFFMGVLQSGNINLVQLCTSVIQARDAQGKFDI